MPVASEAGESITVFISYAQKDKKLLNELELQLGVLQRYGMITSWSEGNIVAGERRKHEIDAHLNSARIILLLVSPDFIAADHCYREMEQAIERHRIGKACTIPILLRPTAPLEGTPLGELSVLPTNGKPVTLWHNRDLALANVASGLGKVVEKLLSHGLPSIYRRVIYYPPPCDARTILQRENAVHAVYTRLVQTDISAMVLMGIVGGGKSTLAALVYHYAEKQRRAGKGPFIGEALWLKMSPAVTMVDIAGTLFEAMGGPSLDFGKLAAESMVVELFNALEAAREPRLIILDQFEDLLDPQTGCGRIDCPGVSEWLDILNSQLCNCRILLTSRIRPRGMREYPSTYLQEFPVSEFTVPEGIALLRKWGVSTKETELAVAVERCRGHAQSLVLLQKLLKDRSISIPAFFDDSTFVQQWADISGHLLNYIYTQQLNQVQQDVLLAFSVYREAVPLEAAQPTRQTLLTISKRKLLAELDVLHSQHLLQNAGNGFYELHPMIADFARGHFVEDDEEANEQVLRKSHSAAAQYYLQQSLRNNLPKEHRRSTRDLHDLVEATWHYCRAGQYQEAYNLIRQEGVFLTLQRWGGNAILLEIYRQLLPSDLWQPERAQAACIYNEIGEIYRMVGQKRVAQQFYERALELFRELEESNEIVNTLNNMGTVFRLQGKIDRALVCYQEAWLIYQEADGRIDGGGTTLNNLGKAVYDLGMQEQGLKRKQLAFKQYTQALSYYEQALPLHRSAGSAAEEARTMGNIGELYEVLGRKEEAYQYYLEALQRFRDIGERWGEASVLNNLGKLFYRELGKQEDALEYYGQALDIFRAIGDRWDEGVLLKNIGRLYVSLKRYDVVVACFLRAKDIFEELQSPERGMMPYWIEATLRSELGDQRYETLIVEVGQRALRIIEQALRGDITWKE